MVEQKAADHILDTRGLLCPMPVIRTQDTIAQLATSNTLHIIASDPGTLHDIPAWCRVHGHEVVVASEEDPIDGTSPPADEFHFIVTVIRP